MPNWVDKILNSQSVQLGLAAVAFLIALLLVIVIARMLMGGRLRLPGSRARQARLGIVDAFDLDRQRQLIIVRRDNTEHLIMIGGPNDLVIESEIVRVEARDFRDNRREKSFEGAGVEGRIPVRIGVPNGDGALPEESLPSRMDEPLLPLDLPAGEIQIQPANMSADAAPGMPAAEPAVSRGPTFPLPPRRPAPVPERRPPPLLPDRASRADNQVSPPPVAPDVPPQAAPIMPPPSALPVAAPAPAPITSSAPTPPIPATPTPDVGTRPLLARPSILKPLPPRPPMRPLKRTTPSAEGSNLAATRQEPAAPALSPTPDAPGAPAPTPSPVLPPILPPAMPRAIPPTPPQDLAPPPIAANPPPAPPPEADALESLEDEMAKLLGRG